MTESPEMVERVGDAIEDAERPILTGRETPVTIGELLDLLEMDGYLHPGEREMLADAIARAAIKAMREPTEAMLQAVADPYSPGQSKSQVLDLWQRVCDAALGKESA